MIEIIKKISPKSEFILVILLAFGYSIFISLVFFFDSFFSLSYSQISFTNGNLIGTGFYEILIMIILYEFLQIRNSLIDFQNKYQLGKLLLSSLLLIIIYYSIYFILIFIISHLFANNSMLDFSQVAVNNNLNLFIIIIFSIVNSIFEETLVVGYVVSKLSTPKGVFFTVNTSILIRFLYHLYQGPIAALTIIPLGILFVFVYIKWKNIWPLIFAHCVMDILALYLHGL